MSKIEKKPEGQQEKRTQTATESDITGNQTETSPFINTHSHFQSPPGDPMQSLANQLGDKRLSSVQRQSLARQISQTAGNHYLQRVIATTRRKAQIEKPDGSSSEVINTTSSVQRQERPAAGSVPPSADSGAAAPVQNARPTASELVTIATGAINAEYTSAARDGLTDFESIVGATLDYSALVTALAGNVIWATACFATGGTAFLVSLAGIAVSTAAPAASGSVDRATFHQQSTDEIEAIRTHLLNQIARVTGDINQQAAAENWDDFQTRRELLGRLLRPQYIAVVAGGLPTVDRAAIAQSIKLDLLTRANSYGASLLHPGGGGQFIYDYNVSGHYTDSGIWPFDSQPLTPVTGWQFVRGGTQLYIPQGESGAFAVYQHLPLIQPSEMAFAKTVYIHSTGAAGDLIIRLDQSNNVIDATGYGVFENFAQPPSHGPSRSAPPPPDTVGVSRSIVTQMWNATGGRPAWVRGQDLQEAAMPGRSRATR
jgi:hypothetical protein